MARITIIQAALQYGDGGWSCKIFPVPPGTKKSYKSAKFSKGERWGATSDPKQIKKDFARWKDAGIGFPTGAENKIVVIETDTKAGHPKLKVEGAVSLKALEARLGPLPATLMSRSPSGSVHRLFNHPGGHVRCRSIAEGVDVKGDGGMVLVPPSVRGDGAYEWISDDPVADLPPAWAEYLSAPETHQDRPVGDLNPFEEYGRGDDEDPPTLADLRDCVELIPNEDLDYDDWTTVLMRFHKASSGTNGKECARAWSSKSEKHDDDYFDTKWALIENSPATQYTAHSIVTLARNGFYQEETEASEDSEDADPAPAPKMNGVHHAATDATEGPDSILNEPFDFWGKFKVPELPRGLLPKLIEDYAFTVSELQGSDPSGLAMGALVCCGVAIPDCHQLQPKPIGEPWWRESARIWVALVGEVSSMKTPMINAAVAPIKAIERQLVKDFMVKRIAYDKLDKDQKAEVEEPHCPHIILEDTTSHGAQDVLRYSPDGILCVRDELSALYGAIEQYGAHGQGVERPYWLQSYNGGEYYVNRAKGNARGSFVVPNNSVAFFGGIQPDVIRRIDDDKNNDGLVQRSITILVRNAVEDRDFPAPPVVAQYEDLVVRLRKIKHERSDILQFTPGAMEIRKWLADEHLQLTEVFGYISPKLANHIGKYNGIFARLCLIWHHIEHSDDPWVSNIDEDTARRVARFMHDFLLPHAIAFYTGVLDITGDYGKLKSIAGYILAHRKNEVSNRDMLRGVSSMKGLKAKEIEAIFEQLEACSWLTRGVSNRYNAPRWKVNPVVFSRFAEVTKLEIERRDRVRNLILSKAELVRGQRGAS